MDKQQLENEIKSYLDQDELDYWEGVELYSEHPNCRKNVVMTLNQRWMKDTMHSKLVYELEKIVGTKFTNRQTILKQRPATLPYKVIEETKEKAPANYEYKIAYEKLPEELKAVVIEKGQLYNAMEQHKKKLADIGEQNDDQSVSKRAVILKDMRRMSDRIKRIHSLLMIFDKKDGFEIPEKTSKKKAETLTKELNAFNEGLEQLKSTPIGGTTQVPEEKKELSLDEELEEEFQYKEMTYWKRKDLLVKLRSSVLKQEQRAESTKKNNIKDKNLQKAEQGRKMIEVLEQYFKATEEPVEVIEPNIEEIQENTEETIEENIEGVLELGEVAKNGGIQGTIEKTQEKTETVEQNTEENSEIDETPENDSEEPTEETQKTNELTEENTEETPELKDTTEENNEVTTDPEK